MLYQISNGAVRFGDTTILENVCFEIRNTEKIAVVGRNGCGKTTLLKLIAGEVDLDKRDSDEDIFIAKAGNPEIGYLRQIAFEDLDLPMEKEVRKAFASMEEMKARLDYLAEELNHNHTEKAVQDYTQLHDHFQLLGGYYYEKEYEVMIQKFGFTQEDKRKPLREFSGGQQTKIAFIKLLLSKPDILLLDEPTNHLDVEAIEWLESYIKGYPRAVVVVSHDRMFLDNVVDVVYEIEHHTAKRYPGNYSQFMVRKKENYEKQMKDYLAQQKEIDRLNTIVDKFKNKPTKVAMTRSKLKAIEHMDKIDKPEDFDNKTFRAQIKPLVETGNDVLMVKNLEVGYDSTLSMATIDIKKGDKIGILGGNGLGKSTFLKTLVGILEPLGGEFKYGTNVQIGYFDQQMAQYQSKDTVIDDLWAEFPTLTQTEIRNLLGGFLFSGDDVFKTVDMLSGGEKVRLALCKILKRRPNVLILDEPTNHMDIVGKETLEDMLKDYEGTLIFVSHDRYFIKQISNRLLVFEKGYTKEYQFGYEQYQEMLRRAQEEALASNEKSSEKAEPRKDSSYNNPGKEKSKLEKKLKKLEEMLSQEEKATEELKAELLNPQYQSDYMKLGEIQSRIDEKEELILSYMEEWEELNQQLEKFN